MVLAVKQSASNQLTKINQKSDIRSHIPDFLQKNNAPEFHGKVNGGAPGGSDAVDIPKCGIGDASLVEEGGPAER